MTLPHGALWVCGHGSHVAWSLTLALTGSPHASPCQEGDLKCASDGRVPLSPGACGQGIPSVVACFCRGSWGETKKGTSAIWRPVPFLGIACAVLVLAGLTLAELEALASARLTGLLTFLLAGVAGEHSGLLERRAESLFGLLQSPFIVSFVN